MEDIMSGGQDHTSLRVGLVGGGRMAQHHARAIGRAKGATLLGIADPAKEALEALQRIAPEAAAYRSLDDMVSGVRLDAIHICTPPLTHMALAKQALEAGCHIYVEKPFSPTADEASNLLSLADSLGLVVCSGHQLLFESPARVALELLPALGRISHIESYFSFRTVRRAPGGRVPLRSDLQLLDILPHPTYLLLHFLELAHPEGESEVAALEVGESGTIHALIRRGSLTANLTVSLQARPVESFVRICGSNGSLHADFVRGSVQRLIGPGTSGIDKVLAPYRTSMQLLTGTTSAVARRVLKQQKSYPGLVEIFEAFYQSARTGAESPTSPESIVDTVSVCERVATQLNPVETLPAIAPPQPTADALVVTGGTGFLGREICKEGIRQGFRVYAIARREPAAWERIVGVEYLTVDLGAPLPANSLPEADVLIHAAAETAGSWPEHERNSINATRNVISAAAVAGIRSVIHISSVAVLETPFGRPIRDDEKLKERPRIYGPYVWGKLRSEQVAGEVAADLGLALRIVRPGPIVDFEEFDPPGRLGKRLGGMFIAVGSGRQRLGVVDVKFAARMLVWMTKHLEDVPTTLNLLNPISPTKKELVTHLRRNNPGLRVLWLPRPILHILSWAAVFAQKAIRPRTPAVAVAKVFAVQPYDTSLVTALAARLEVPGTESIPSTA